MFLHDLPALALVWYVSKGSLAADPFRRPVRSDLYGAFGAFLVLVGVSSLAGLAASRFPGSGQEAFLEPPAGFGGWLAALLSCAATGYLEEAFFRAYLLTKLEGLAVPRRRAVLLSVLLFSLCHLYEGPWGVLNSALAGTALALLFLRLRNVHAPAWAHAAYNAFVYLQS